MRLLSIETSCDDTAISIFEVTGGVQSASFKVLANNTNSQINIHIPYGGVYPMLAKREHKKNLPILLEASLLEAKLDKKQKPVDAIAVTYGPGLEMCLWEGILFAQELARKWNVPIIPTNHMEGHVLSPFGKSKKDNKTGKFKITKLKMPMLSLLVSGGHTQLVLSNKWLQYEIIGNTMDDAVGEAFDKVARTLGLPYPGGPQISKLAESLRSTSPAKAGTPQEENKISLPRPMLHSKNFDFSFSGLKTAVLYLVRDLGGLEKLDEKTKAEIALEFENAAIECLVHKTAKAVEKYKIQTLVVAGGVAANKHLKNEMEKLANQNRKQKIKLMFPTRELATDNSLMIGIVGYLNYIKNKKKVPNPKTIKATGSLKLGK